MNKIHQFFRNWIYLTIAFVILSILSCMIVTGLRFDTFNKENKDLYLQAMQWQILMEYSSIAEEAYLHLGTIKIREKRLNKILGSKGVATLQLLVPSANFEKNPTVLKTENGQDLKWNREITSDKESYRIPLFFADSYLGELFLTVQWKNFWSSVELRAMLLNLLFLFVTLVAIWLMLSLIIRKKIMGPLVDEFARLTRVSAVAQTTQMLAHDVRRPFSMLKAALNILLDLRRNPDEIESFVKELIVDVQKALNSVNGMIKDVMEIGSESPINPVPTDPESLIETSLIEVFQHLSNENITFKYNLRHTHFPLVENLKILRVIINLIENARQAAGKGGKLWFSTSDFWENGKSYVQFSVGNTGKFIPQVDIKKVFEAFYTKGKSGGTGLGLAIAHKVITAHGGRIWCESNQEKGTEFYFIIPSSNVKSSDLKRSMPIDTEEIISKSIHGAKLLGEQTIHSEESLKDHCRLKLINTLRSSMKRDNKYNLVVIDDEPLYIELIKSRINSDQELSKYFEVFSAQNHNEAFGLIDKSNPVLTVVDIDLGHESMNGFDIVNELKKKFIDGLVCIHSNRFLNTDYSKSIDVGANAFFPKPMSQDHLCKLLNQAIIGQNNNRRE